VPAVPQQFSVSSDYFNIYKAYSESSSLNILYRNTEFNSLFHFNNTRLYVNLGTTNSFVSWKTTQNDLKNNLELKQNYSSVSLYSTFNNLFLDSKVILNNYQQKWLFDYSIKMGFVNLNRNNQEFDVSFRKTSVPISWNLLYQAAGFNINSDQSFYLTSVNFSVSIDNLTLGLSYERNISIKDKSSEIYSMDAKPIYDNIKFEIKNRSDYLPVSFDISRTSLIMKSHLLMNDVQFSSINISDLSLLRINSDIQLNCFNIPLGLSISYNYLKGNVSGNIESWPFTDIIQSIVANRLNYQAYGSVNVMESSLSSKMIFKKFSIKPVIDIYYINPDLTLQDWQPVYLVFGIKDYNENTDCINYMLLGRAGTEAAVDIGIAVVSLNIYQFFPLLIRKDNPQNINSGNSVTIFASSSSPTKISGGTFLTLTLTKSF